MAGFRPPVRSGSGGVDQAAVDAAVAAAVADLLDGAPGALDTLNELAAAVNDDASFAASVTTALAAKETPAGAQAKADAKVDNTVYDATSWDGVTGVAPSKNAVRDKIEALSGTFAPLASPALTGNPTAPTPAAGDADTSIATTAFVAAATTPTRKRRIGAWYTATVDLFGSLSTSNGFTNGEMQAYPFEVLEPETFDAAGLEITVSGSSGAAWRVAIYADSGGLPSGSPLAQVSIDMTVAAGLASNTFASPIALPRGAYWIVDGLQGNPSPTKPTVRYGNSVFSMSSGLGSSGGIFTVSGGAPGSGPYVMTGQTGTLGAWSGSTRGANYFRPVGLRKANP